MRELVYLSQRKVGQFLPEPSWWNRLSRQASVEVSTPVGKVELQGRPADRDPAAGLAAAIAEIENTAVWYGQPDIAVGQWVQFEAVMNCVLLTDSYYSIPEPDVDGLHRFVLFVEQPANAGPRPLLLHGHRRHLLDGFYPDTEPVDFLSLAPDPSSGLGIWAVLANASEPDAVDEHLRVTGGFSLRRPDKADFAESLVDRIDRRGLMPSQTAERVAGYARVTVAGLRSVVIATPLYVQRVQPP